MTKTQPLRCVRWPTIALVLVAASAFMLAILDSLDVWGLALLFRRGGYLAGFLILLLGLYRAHRSAQREDKIFENRRASGERSAASLGFTVAQILRAISVLVTASRRRRASELGAVIRSIVTQASRQLDAQLIIAVCFRLGGSEAGVRVLLPWFSTADGLPGGLLSAQFERHEFREASAKTGLWRLVDSEIDQLLITDVNEQRRRGRHVPLGLLSGALIALPVRVSGVTVGVLAVLSEVPDCFAGGDLVVLQCFGEALGIAEGLAGSRGLPVHPR